MPDLKTAEGVASHMSEATSEKDWNSRCEEVKNANEGDYPSFWFSTIILSGLSHVTELGWYQ